jgi:hypothetical protein
MTVILDQYPLLETGTFEIRQMVTVHISAEEARRKVARWLRMEISHMLGADTPTLVVGQRTIWRVPAHFSAPRVGIVGAVGEVEVDAITGEICERATCQAQIEQRADALAATLPPFQPYATVPLTALPVDVPRAPMIILNEAGDPILAPVTGV